jgi:hypothetical protein
MPITSQELIAFASASRPEDDVSTSGGAIDLENRPEYTDLASADTIFLESDGADTRFVDIQGRNAAGAVISEQVQLAGGTGVTSVNTYERLHFVRATTTSATRTVSVFKGANNGGDPVGTIPVDEKGFYRMFLRSASDPDDPVDRYEKIFLKNTNGTLTGNDALVTLTADPAGGTGRIEIGRATAVDDTGSVANRLTPPGGVSFVDDDVDITLPGDGNLDANEAIGVWIKQGLLAGDNPFKSTFTVRLRVTST